MGDAFGVISLIRRCQLKLPMNCPEKLYDIMFNCWKEEPECRPTFETLEWQLEEYFMS